MKRFFHRWFHFWYLVHDSGANSYFECEVCGKRMASRNGGGYQPFDEAWLSYAPFGPCGTTERVSEQFKKWRGVHGYNVPDGDYYPPRPTPPPAPPPPR